MKPSLLSALVLILSTPAAIAAAEPPHFITTAREVKWAAGPPSLPPGAKAAILYGDPAKEGMFVMRLKLPPKYRIPPHTHPRPEIVTVISGVFNIGMDSSGERRRARALSAGSFFAFAPGMTHYASVDRETIVQLSSTGPWTINYVNAADDPRKK